MKHKFLKRFFIILFVFLFILFTGFYIYTLDYYKADEFVVEVGLESSLSITENNNYTVIKPKLNTDTGFIFYPGAKVEDQAYLPILAKIASSGITCVLVKMPFNLAVFGINSANKIISDLTEINTWYIGGHSLGGSMSTMYANKHKDIISGVILFAAYPTKDVGVPTIAIYGSNDTVLNKSKLLYIDELYEITGGNHANFGNYGAQKGDGLATISKDEQLNLTTIKVLEFINKRKTYE